ncbi:NAD(P)H-dependent oxidoreductase [Ruegeria sp. HU-ET01832]|uniref:flavodoxin family protein n=1 Tax=Ruegeria sp. HU-ET01832 TaxID=3135906 RepID=UPI00310388AA
MAQLLIVYHSRTGGARQMAEAAAQAARDEADVVLKTADQAGPEDLLQADGYIFCAPENLAAISGLMKEFFDRSYYPVLGGIEGRPYAQMVCAGSDGENAARQTARIATGWRLKEVQPPLIICTHAQTPEAILAEKTIPDAQLDNCRELGLAMAAGLAMGVF